MSQILINKNTKILSTVSSAVVTIQNTATYCPKILKTQDAKVTWGAKLPYLYPKSTLLHIFRMLYLFHHFGPGRGAKYCDLRSTCLYVCSLCLSVCPLARVFKNRMSKVYDFFFTCYLSPVAVGRSSSDCSAIRYVLPVLWITSFSHNGANGPESWTTLFRRVREVAVAGAKLLFSTAGLFYVALISAQQFSCALINS